MMEARLNRPAFELPAGVLLDGGRRLDSVELRPLTGREEEWLSRNSEAPAHAVTGLLSRCVTVGGGIEAGTDVARRLLVGDRDFLMLQLRRLTLGERIQAVLECPACAKKMDVAFEAGEVPVERRPRAPAEYTVRLASQARPVRFRLPNGADQEAVLGLPVDEAARELLSRCLLDPTGASLTEEEQQAVIDEMEQAAPRVELELDLQCPECAHRFLAPFDVAHFFLKEMRLGWRQLLEEVHLLALHYHWSESEILGLARSRRRAYLELLSDSMRQER